MFVHVDDPKGSEHMKKGLRQNGVMEDSSIVIVFYRLVLIISCLTKFLEFYVQD